jgi:hypothetical protein
MLGEPGCSLLDSSAFYGAAVDIGLAAGMEMGVKLEFIPLTDTQKTVRL